MKLRNQDLIEKLAQRVVFVNVIPTKGKNKYQQDKETAEALVNLADRLKISGSEKVGIAFDTTSRHHLNWDQSFPLASSVKNSRQRYYNKEDWEVPPLVENLSDKDVAFVSIPSIGSDRSKGLVPLSKMDPKRTQYTTIDILERVQEFLEQSAGNVLIIPVNDLNNPGASYMPDGGSVANDFPDEINQPYVTSIRNIYNDAIRHAFTCTLDQNNPADFFIFPPKMTGVEIAAQGGGAAGGGAQPDGAAAHNPPHELPENISNILQSATFNLNGARQVREQVDLVIKPIVEQDNRLLEDLKGKLQIQMVAYEAYKNALSGSDEEKHLALEKLNLAKNKSIEAFSAYQENALTLIELYTLCKLSAENIAERADVDDNPALNNKKVNSEAKLACDYFSRKFSQYNKALSDAQKTFNSCEKATNQNQPGGGALSGRRRTLIPDTPIEEKNSYNARNEFDSCEKETNQNQPGSRSLSGSRSTLIPAAARAAQSNDSSPTANGPKP
jgi:hypothetical protein